MLYRAETVSRTLIADALVELRRTSGTNTLISKREQAALTDDLQAAADRVRAAKGKGARITVAEVLTDYARNAAKAIGEVNSRGAHFLSAKETDQLDPALKQRAWDVRADMKQASALQDELSPEGTFRREISDRYVHDGEDAIKVAFFDADSTLRVSLSGNVSANDAKDVAALPFVGATIADLVAQGYLIAVVSNQGGVAAGFVTFDNADAALETTADLIRGAGGDVHYLDFAEARDEFRKPNTGMGELLEAKLKERFGESVYIDKESSFMVGDSAYKASDTRPDGTPGTHFSNSDRKFAENFGVPFHEPQDFFAWSDFGSEGFRYHSQVGEFWTNLLGA